MTVLERISHAGARIFEVEKLPSGNFRLDECCDYYYHIELTPHELIALGEELIALARTRG